MHWITSTQSVTYHACHDLDLVLWLLLLWRQGEDHCGKEDNRNPGRDKVPINTIESATCGKVYLRDDLCPFNVSSFLDLYTQNLSGYTHILERNSRASYLSEVHLYIFHLSFTWFSSWHPRPLKLGSISSS